MLRPPVPADLPELTALKADPRVYAIMLEGVQTPARAAEELAEDLSRWSRCGFGTWVVRSPEGGPLLGLTALQERPDGRGIGLRFAFFPHAQGRGLAAEAASAALRFGHGTAGLSRIVAVARGTNFGSLTVLGSIGMREIARFARDGWEMVLCESLAPAPFVWPRLGAVAD